MKPKFEIIFLFIIKIVITEFSDFDTASFFAYMREYFYQAFRTKTQKIFVRNIKFIRPKIALIVNFLEKRVKKAKKIAK